MSLFISLHPFSKALCAGIYYSLYYFYSVKYGCVGEIKLPTSDADGDSVSCRLSTGNECASICGKIPASAIDQVIMFIFVYMFLLST